VAEVRNPQHPVCIVTGKQKYKSQEGAENFLRTLVRSKRYARRAAFGTAEIRAYHCPHCDGWHLTHQSKRER
jgi:hypothetical protein